MKELIVGVLFFCIPILVQGWFIWKRDLKVWEKVFRCVSVCAASNIAVMLVHMHYGLIWTTYEYLFLEVEISVLAAMLIVPFLTKEKITSKSILHMVCLMAASAAFYSILSYGQTVIHSDTATAVLLAQSQKRHKNFFPLSWSYGNGDLWVLSLNIFVMPFSLLLHNQSLARVLGSAFLIMMTMGGIFYQSRKVFKDDSWMLSIPLLFVFLHGHSLWNSSSDMILYQAAYTILILWMTFAYTWNYVVFSGNIDRKIVYFMVLMMLLCMGGIRAVAEYTLPLWCACMIMIYDRNKEKKRLRDCKDGVKQAVFLSAVVWVPALAGYGIYKWISATHIVRNTNSNAIRFADSFQDCCNNFITVIVDMFDNFGYIGSKGLFSIHGISNMISVAACVLIVFVIPIMQLIRLKEESEATVHFYLFGMVHNFIMLLMGVLFGKIYSRYMLTSIFVCMMISAHYMMTHWMSPNTLQRKMRIAVFIAAAVVQCARMLSHSAGWAESLKEKKEFAQELAGRGLEKGYATYWNAYTNEVYSDLQLRMGGIYVNKRGISLHKWLVDQDIYQIEETNTFLLLSAKENKVISRKLPDLYGNPVQKFMLDDMYIYVFDHDIIENIK